MILALAMALCARVPAGNSAARIEDPAERRAFDRGQQALAADHELLGLHRSLHAYLAADPELRQAEENLQALRTLPGFRARLDDFEEVLRADAAARRDFDRAYSRLQRDPALRDAIDALGTVESEAARGRLDLAAAFMHLRAHPELTRDFLVARGAGGRSPDRLAALRGAVARDPGLGTRLRDAWTRLDAMAGAREGVYPWWARVYGGPGAAARSWRGLDLEFAAFPARRRAWEDREAAWAAHPEGAAWRDYLYARMRRDPALAQGYFDFLRGLRNGPDLERRTEETFTVAFGAPAPWPPTGAPPRLAPWTPHALTKRPQAPIAPPPRTASPKPFRQPAVTKPAGPSRPAAPARTPTPPATAAPESDRF